MRDYVIGISAVDGRGVPFKAGGRVVKNVAGYDFCKLLTGSLGTLGVITQVTLKIKPRPEHTSLVVCEVRDFDCAERLLAALVQAESPPSAIELLTGAAWEGVCLSDSPTGRGAGCLAVCFEGSEAEVIWMTSQWIERWLSPEMKMGNVPRIDTFVGHEAGNLMNRLRDFPASNDSPLVIKASLKPKSQLLHSSRL